MSHKDPDLAKGIYQLKQNDQQINFFNQTLKQHQYFYQELDQYKGDYIQKDQHLLATLNQPNENLNDKPSKRGELNQSHLSNYQIQKNEVKLGKPYIDIYGTYPLSLMDKDVSFSQDILRNRFNEQLNCNTQQENMILESKEDHQQVTNIRMDSFQNNEENKIEDQNDDENMQNFQQDFNEYEFQNNYENIKEKEQNFVNNDISSASGITNQYNKIQEQEEVIENFNNINQNDNNQEFQNLKEEKYIENTTDIDNTQQQIGDLDSIDNRQNFQNYEYNNGRNISEDQEGQMPLEQEIQQNQTDEGFYDDNLDQFENLNQINDLNFNQNPNTLNINNNNSQEGQNQFLYNQQDNNDNQQMAQNNTGDNNEFNNLQNNNNQTNFSNDNKLQNQQQGKFINQQQFYVEENQLPSQIKLLKQKIVDTNSLIKNNKKLQLKITNLEEEMKSIKFQLENTQDSQKKYQSELSCKNNEISDYKQKISVMESQIKQLNVNKKKNRNEQKNQQNQIIEELRQEIREYQDQLEKKTKRLVDQTKLMETLKKQETKCSNKETQSDYSYLRRQDSMVQCSIEIQNPIQNKIQVINQAEPIKQIIKPEIQSVSPSNKSRSRSSLSLTFEEEDDDQFKNEQTGLINNNDDHQLEMNIEEVQPYEQINTKPDQIQFEENDQKTQESERKSISENNQDKIQQNKKSKISKIDEIANKYLSLQDQKENNDILQYENSQLNDSSLHLQLEKIAKKIKGDEEIIQIKQDLSTINHSFNSTQKQLENSHTSLQSLLNQQNQIHLQTGNILQNQEKTNNINLNHTQSLLDIKNSILLQKKEQKNITDIFDSKLSSFQQEMIKMQQQFLEKIQQQYMLTFSQMANEAQNNNQDKQKINQDQFIFDNQIQSFQKTKEEKEQDIVDQKVTLKQELYKKTNNIIENQSDLNQQDHLIQVEQSQISIEQIQNDQNNIQIDEKINQIQIEQEMDIQEIKQSLEQKNIVVNQKIQKEKNIQNNQTEEKAVQQDKNINEKKEIIQQKDNNQQKDIIQQKDNNQQKDIIQQKERKQKKDTKDTHIEEKQKDETKIKEIVKHNKQDNTNKKELPKSQIEIQQVKNQVKSEKQPTIIMAKPQQKNQIQTQQPIKEDKPNTVSKQQDVEHKKQSVKRDDEKQQKKTKQVTKREKTIQKSQKDQKQSDKINICENEEDDDDIVIKKKTKKIQQIKDQINQNTQNEQQQQQNINQNSLFPNQSEQSNIFPQQQLNQQIASANLQTPGQSEDESDDKFDLKDINLLLENKKKQIFQQNKAQPTISNNPINNNLNQLPNKQQSIPTVKAQPLQNTPQILQQEQQLQINPLQNQSNFNQQNWNQTYQHHSMQNLLNFFPSNMHSSPIQLKNVILPPPKPQRATNIQISSSKEDVKSNMIIERPQFIDTEDKNQGLNLIQSQFNVYPEVHSPSISSQKTQIVKANFQLTVPIVHANQESLNQEFLEQIQKKGIKHFFQDELSLHDYSNNYYKIFNIHFEILKSMKNEQLISYKDILNESNIENILLQLKYSMFKECQQAKNVQSDYNIFCQYFLNRDNLQNMKEYYSYLFQKENIQKNEQLLLKFDPFSDIKRQRFLMILCLLCMHYKLCGLEVKILQLLEFCIKGGVSYDFIYIFVNIYPQIYLSAQQEPLPENSRKMYPINENLINKLISMKQYYSFNEADNRGIIVSNDFLNNNTNKQSNANIQQKANSNRKNNQKSKQKKQPNQQSNISEVNNQLNDVEQGEIIIKKDNKDEQLQPIKDQSQTKASYTLKEYSSLTQTMRMIIIIVIYNEYARCQSYVRRLQIHQLLQIIESYLKINNEKTQMDEIILKQININDVTKRFQEEGQGYKKNFMFFQITNPFEKTNSFEENMIMFFMKSYYIAFVDLQLQKWFKNQQQVYIHFNYADFIGSFDLLIEFIKMTDIKLAEKVYEIVLKGYFTNVKYQFTVLKTLQLLNIYKLLKIISNQSLIIEIQQYFQKILEGTQMKTAKSKDYQDVDSSIVQNFIL